MKVRQFSSELTGGTGIAAQRLHRELRRLGIDSILHHRTGFGTEESVIADRRKKSSFWRLAERLAVFWQRRAQEHERGPFLRSRWLFSSRLRDFGVIPDLINLHLTFRWIDLPSFYRSIPSGLPVIWSLHDLHVISGGCQHRHECEKIASGCGNCPNLVKPGRRDVSWNEVQLKSGFYRRLNLHLVANSEWTESEATRSTLGKLARSISVIPPGLDPCEFRPIDAGVSRAALGIERSAFVVAFGCADFGDRNKNASGLIEAVRVLAERESVTLLVFGAGRLPTIDGKVQLISVGNLSSSSLQRLVYSAADVFVVPSLIESFGLTALEAMACGTPVLAYRTGGLKNLVVSGETGLLVEPVGSSMALANALRWFRAHPVESHSMGVSARSLVESRFTIQRTAANYLELYAKASRNQPESNSNRHSSVGGADIRSS